MQVIRIEQGGKTMWLWASLLHWTALLMVFFPGFTVSHVDNHLFHFRIIWSSTTIFSRVSNRSLIVPIIVLVLVDSYQRNCSPFSPLSAKRSGAL